MNGKEGMFVDYTHITLERRFVPFMVAFVFLLIFIAFMIGYFLGVKYTTDEFITQIRQETMADQILVCSSAAAQQQPGVQGTQQEEAATNAPTIAPEVAVQATPIVVANATPQLAAEQPAATAATQAVRYGAELIGFGTKRAGEEFVERVASYSTTPLILKERASKSPRGRRIHWYQVVTNTYEHKDELQQFLDMLIKKEHLHDIKIVAYAATKKDLA
jgi:hypothetical protein